MGCPALLFSSHEQEVRHPLRRNSCALRKKEAESMVIFERLNGMGGKDVNKSRDARNIVNGYRRRGSSYITMSNCRPCCLHSPDVPVVSCSDVDLAVVDVLTSVDVPGVAMLLLQPILLMTSLLLLEFPSLLVSPLLLASLLLMASLLLSAILLLLLSLL